MADTGSLFKPQAYVERVRALAPGLRFREDVYGVVDEVPLLALTREALDPERDHQPIEPRATVYLAAGLHGDEPAGPLAILRLMTERWFPTDVAWHILPMMNPSGLGRGTRENGQGVDINRDYTAFTTYEAAQHRAWLETHAPGRDTDNPDGYTLSLLLHEDWEANGFYCYEVRDLERNRPSVAPAILGAAGPICGIDPGDIIDERIAKDGLIAPLEFEPELDFSDLPGLPEALFLYQHHSSLNYTLETPSAQYLETRVRCQAEAVKAAVATLLEHLPSPGDA
ncbi:MAG: M14 family metallopeptidase [Opitutales bacterium]